MRGFLGVPKTAVVAILLIAAALAAYAFAEAAVVSHAPSQIVPQGAGSGLDADRLQNYTAASILSSPVQWSQLTGFPATCPAGQFLTGIGSSLACAKAQAQGPVLVVKGGGYYSSSGVDAARTSDGGMIVMGSVYGPDFGVGSRGAAWLLKLSSSDPNSVQWTRAIGEPIYSVVYNAKSVAQAPDGGYIIGGNVYNSTGDEYGDEYDYAFLIKTDSSGNVAVRKLYGAGAGGEIKKVAPAPDGGYIASGQIYENGKPYVVAKFDSSLSFKWGITNKVDAWSSNYGDYVMPVTGGYIAMVSAGTSPTDCRIVRLDAGGNVLWNKSIGLQISGWGPCEGSLAPTSDGNYLAAAGKNVKKFDSSGNVWLSGNSYLSSDKLYSVTEDSDGNIVAAGMRERRYTSGSTNYGYFTGLMVKFTKVQGLTGSYVFEQWPSWSYEDIGDAIYEAVALPNKRYFVVGRHPPGTIWGGMWIDGRMAVGNHLLMGEVGSDGTAMLKLNHG